MDEGKILLVNLSKGKIGDLNTQLLGMIIVSQISNGAMSRANIPEDERKDFYLYVDEFQNFVTNTFASWLSWQGYFMYAIGGKAGAWAFANLGVVFALAIGFVGHLLVAKKKIQKQESF